MSVVVFGNASPSRVLTIITCCHIPKVLRCTNVTRMILSQWCALRSTISARSSRQTSLNSICRVLIRFSQSNYSSFSQLPSAYCYPRNALYIAFYTQNRRALSRAFASGSSRVNVRTISSTGIPVSKSLSYTEKIKVILKEYGTVGFVFHMGMSLMSVGTCYLLVDK